MLQFRLFQGFVWILNLFPYRARRAFFLGLSTLASRIDFKHREVIRRNLAFAYDAPLEDAEIEGITKGCFNNAAMAFTQIIENYRFDPDTLDSRVQFENTAPIEAAIAAKRPIIFVTAHFGNWELAGAAISNRITPITVIYQKLNNPYFNDYLYASRRAVNIETVEKSGAARALAKLLKNGGAVTLLTDQRTRRRDGVEVDFFGKAVYHPATPAFLARKYDAVIIPLYTFTDDHEHYRVVFESPIEVAKSDDADADIREASVEQIRRHEAAIRKRPDLWFWCHRRWKRIHPEIYR